MPFHTSNVEQTIAARGLRYTFEREISCPANSTTWIMLGCGDMLNVDTTSNHIGQFQQNGVNYVMGAPVEYIAPAAVPTKTAIGFMFQRLNSVGYPVSSNMGGVTAGNDVLAVFSDDNQRWPILTPTLNDSTRWCPISYGIDIRRTNAALNAAGDWFSITPINSSLSGANLLRTNMTAYPSFKKHGSESCTVKVMARPHDMAFQHGIGTSNPNMTNPVIVLNFENGTGNALSFDLTASVKFAVAGSASTKVLSSIDASPAHAQLLSATSSAVGSGVAPGHASTAVAEAVHSAIAVGKSALDAAASVGQKVKAAGEWLKPFSGSGFA